MCLSFVFAAGLGGSRVIDALVVNGRKDLIEMLGDLMEVLQSELALVQLAIDEDVVDQPVDHPLNAGLVSGRVRERQAASTTSASMTRPASLVWGLGPGYR